MSGDDNANPVKQGEQPLLYLLLVVLVFAAFLPALRNGFTNYDDDVYVTDNANVSSGLSRSNFVAAFTSTEDTGNWHPLTFVSHMLDSQIYGLKPWGHHLTNVLIHAANTLLVFFVFRRMTGATWRSWFLAAVFAVHPLRVESVAWVAERKDVLCAFFWLLTMVAYWRYANGKNSCYLLALLFFSLGLMSKPMIVTLPFVLLLLDYWPLARIGRVSWIRLIAEKLPFILLAAASCAATFYIQRAAGGIVTGRPFVMRAASAVVAYAQYLGKLFWPSNLASMYPLQTQWSPAILILSATLFLAITVLALVLWRRRPYLLVGWLWYVGTLMPVNGLLVQAGVQAFADRYSYLPMLGIVMALTWAVWDLGQHWEIRPAILRSSAIAVLGICVLLTWKQTGYWNNAETLARRTLAVSGHHFVAYNNIGSSLDHQGKLDEALAYYQLAVQYGPNDFTSRKNLASALNRKGRRDEAIQHYRIAVQLRPAAANVHFYLALALERNGDLPGAVAEYQTALGWKPDYPEALNNLGGVLGRINRVDDAIKCFQQALALNPGYAEAHNNLGTAYAIKGDLRAAVAEFQAVLKIKPDHLSAQTNLANALEDLGALTNRPPAGPLR